MKLKAVVLQKNLFAIAMKNVQIPIIIYYWETTQNVPLLLCCYLDVPYPSLIVLEQLCLLLRITNIGDMYKKCYSFLLLIIE